MVQLDARFRSSPCQCSLLLVLFIFPMIFIKFECLVPGGLAHIVEIKLRDSDMNRDNIKEINENRIELEELVYLEEL